MNGVSRSRGPQLVCLLMLCLDSVSVWAQGPIEQASDRFRQDLLVETAGLFWIGAEIAILFCMTAAVRIFATRPFPDRIELTTAERRRGLTWAVLFAVLAIGIFGRHIVFAPLPDALQAIAQSDDDVRARAGAAYLRYAHTHVAVWCSFITAWVILEIAIVVQGVRAYGRLREYLSWGAAQDG